MVLRDVHLDVIDFEDETYRISEELHNDGLKASLHEIGQLNPVVLVEHKGIYLIVCGFRRLHALANLGRTLALARVLKQSDLGLLHTFRLALWDNLAHRQLNPLENARALFTLKNHCGLSDETLVGTYLPIMGLKPHKRVLHGYLRLHALHPGLRCMLDQKRLTLASAERLADSAPEVQDRMGALMGKIRLSASLQREVLDLIEELCAIGDSSPSELLEKPELAALTGDARLSPFQKGMKLREILYGWRNPRLSRALERFHHGRGKLGLPPVVRLTPDPFFETPRLRVDFEVSSAQDFREILAALNAASQTPSLDELFEAE